MYVIEKNEDVQGRGEGTGRGTKEEQTRNIPRPEKPQNLIPPLGGMKLEVTGVFSNVYNSLLRLLHTSKQPSTGRKWEMLGRRLGCYVRLSWKPPEPLG